MATPPRPFFHPNNPPEVNDYLRQKWEGLMEDAALGNRNAEVIAPGALPPGMNAPGTEWVTPPGIELQAPDTADAPPREQMETFKF